MPDLGGPGVLLNPAQHLLRAEQGAKHAPGQQGFAEQETSHRPGVEAAGVAFEERLRRAAGEQESVVMGEVQGRLGAGGCVTEGVMLDVHHARRLVRSLEPLAEAHETKGLVIQEG